MAADGPVPAQRARCRLRNSARISPQDDPGITPHLLGSPPEKSARERQCPAHL